MGLLNTYRCITCHPLATRNKIGAFMRWMRWQIGSRILGWPVIVPFVDNSFLLVKPGMTGATGNIYCGLHEFEDMAFVLHALQKGDLFVDIGANIGAYTVLASVTGATVICFEPVKETYESLLDNLYVNRLDGKIDARMQALGRATGMLTMMADRDTRNQIVTEEEQYSGEVVQVSVSTLDSALAGQVPKLIKIDVEGFETDVVKGGEKTFSDPRLQAVIMELNGSGSKYGYDEDKLHNRMISFGFGSYIYEPFTRKLIDTGGHYTGTGNTLYIRDRANIQLELSAAKQYCINSEQI